MTRPFRDRREAGRHLARRLAAYAHRRDTLVLALPRGGVPVGYEVARALQTPLDVLIVRKLGVPGHEELAMGAIASGGVCTLDHELVAGLRIPRALIAAAAVREQRELERRERAYRGARPQVGAHGRTVILVDDGLATGSTMRAAVEAARRLGASRVVVAGPVASPEACEQLGRVADEVICDLSPFPLHAVGLWYEDFSQTTDDEVRDLLGRASGAIEPATARA
jgi:predicted phosphoribosyltransferase